jgi:hypothetical protein
MAATDWPATKCSLPETRMHLAVPCTHSHASPVRSARLRSPPASEPKCCFQLISIWSPELAPGRCLALQGGSLLPNTGMALCSAADLSQASSLYRWERMPMTTTNSGGSDLQGVWRHRREVAYASHSQATCHVERANALNLASAKAADFVSALRAILSDQMISTFSLPLPWSRSYERMVDCLPHHFLRQSLHALHCKVSEASCGALPFDILNNWPP